MDKDASIETACGTVARRRVCHAVCIALALLAVAGPVRAADDGAKAPWVRVEKTYEPDKPAVVTAEVRNADGFRFSLYERPWHDERELYWRLQLPDGGDAQLAPDSDVAIEVDAHSNYWHVTASPWTPVHRRCLITAAFIDCDDGAYVPGNLLARLAYWLQTGREVKVRVRLASGRALETAFTLRGARSAIAGVVGPFTPEYAAAYRELEARHEQNSGFQQRVDAALRAAEARCGVPTNDPNSACAARIRACILAHDDNTNNLSPAEAKAYVACVESVAP